jgi:hypothetical protein
MTLSLDLHLPHTGGSAKFSDDGRYRWRLTRRWDDRLPTLAIVGHNPSKAGRVRDDNSVRSMTRLVEASGHGGFRLVNLYAGIDTNPKGLRDWTDPIGPENDAYLHQAALNHDLIVLAWGINVDPGRARQVASRMWRAVSGTGGQLAVWG